ncbi:putative beta-N-acetylglucosaminidase [Aspergillus stella-maris]|uniref:putative beta-N-acetylglucosaminidase n=1 Tax=Aspergillus stella-maris TaxID=1810926 RepID=UPI003CCDF0BF
MSTPHPATDIQINTLTLPQHLSATHSIWTSSFPAHPLSKLHLESLLSHSNGHHFLASIDSEPVGFCLVYTKTAPPDERSQGQNHADQNDKPITSTTGYLAVLAVHPDHRNKGVGTALVNEVKSWFKTNFGRCKIEVGSGIPRFWPGIPVPINSSASSGQEDEGISALSFFANRGVTIRPDPPRAVDLYRDTTSFTLDESSDGVEYGAKAKEAGYTFSPLTEEGYEECIRCQQRNFGPNVDWVNAYRTLHPTKYPECIMVGYDSTGRQVAWTLMLPPSPQVDKIWAMPAVCGPSTGLIGCVGVDREQRGSGIGIGLVAAAMESLQKRGVEGVFVDWVAIEGFYERLGFGVWGRYRVGVVIV